MQRRRLLEDTLEELVQCYKSKQRRPRCPKTEQIKPVIICPQAPESQTSEPQQAQPLQPINIKIKFKPRIEMGRCMEEEMEQVISVPTQKIETKPVPVITTEPEVKPVVVSNDDPQTAQLKQVLDIITKKEPVKVSTSITAAVPPQDSGLLKIVELAQQDNVTTQALMDALDISSDLKAKVAGVKTICDDSIRLAISDAIAQAKTVTDAKTMAASALETVMKSDDCQ